MSRPIYHRQRAEPAARPTMIKNLRILPSMHQRFLERDTSDSQETIFNGEQSPCTPTDALNVVFKTPKVCPPTPTKTPNNMKTKSIKKKPKPNINISPSPLFQPSLFDENGLVHPVPLSPLKKPSPAAKRKFAKFQQSISQSPQQHFQQIHHYHDHLHSTSAPKVPLTPGRPQSAKSRRLFSEESNNKEPLRSPVSEEEYSDDDQIEEEDDEELFLYEGRTIFDNKMDLGGDSITPPSNEQLSPNIFMSPQKNQLLSSAKKVNSTSSPSSHDVLQSPELFNDDDITENITIRPSPGQARHLNFADSDDEIEEEKEEFSTQSTSDRDVDEFDLNMGSQNSQMPSCTPPRLTQTLDEQSSQIDNADNSHQVPFILTDTHVHENPFSPERNVRAVLHHSARKSGHSLQIPKTPAPTASPRKSPKSSANKPTMLSTAGELVSNSAEEVVNLYFSRYAEDFEEEAILGDGSFGKVTKCRNKIDGMAYAVKMSKKQIRGKKALNNILKEVHALATLVDNPHIVRYFAAWVEDDRLHLQTELCEGGSLANEIKSRRKFSEDELINLLRQIACGLQQMHSQNIVHLDIKPDNIYITAPGKYKIGDLGLASSALKECKDVIEGDSRYLCRELLNGDIQGPTNTDLTKADIFALGVTIYETATQIELPNNGDEWHAIRDGNLKHLDGNEYSQDFISLLKMMMHPDPTRRPGAMDILQSYYIKKKKPTYEELEKQNRVLETMLRKQKDRENILAKQLVQMQQQLAAATSGNNLLMTSM